MTNTPDQAITAAQLQSKHGPAFAEGMCLQKVRTCYDAPARSLDAAAAWTTAAHKHKTNVPTDIPHGAPVFWTGGSHGHGHIAISTGNGWCWSTDIKRVGWFDHVPIAEIHDKWGLTLVGWTNDLNGVTVYTPPAEKPKPPTLPPTRVSTARGLLDLAAKAAGPVRRSRIKAALKLLPTR